MIPVEGFFVHRCMIYECRGCSARLGVRLYWTFLRCPHCGMAPYTLALRMLYPFAWLLSAGSLLVAAGWMATDAQFSPTLMWTRIDLGVPDKIGQLYQDHVLAIVGEEFHELVALRPRIVAMKGLLAASGVSLAVLLLRLLTTKPTRRVIVSTVVLLTGVGVLAAAADEILWWGVQDRVATQVHRFRAAAQPLQDDWPTQSGELPEAGPYYAHARRPNWLYLQETANSTTVESFGSIVECSPAGVIFFPLEPHHEYYVEYHPNESLPASHDDGLKVHHELDRSVQLEGRWHLAKYVIQYP